MIKIEEITLPSSEQMGFIIEGMRNPMNSWHKSDSHFYKGYITQGINVSSELGKKDFDLMKNLAKSGTDHRKFMRMMTVYVRITAPLYWWKEFDTYKVGTVSNSCSTMHKISEKEFILDDFSHEQLLTEDNIKWREAAPKRVLESVIFCLNEYRKLYIETRDKKYWWQMIQLLPSSYNQTRNIMLNYEVLRNIYDSRRNHKLDEWRKFCDWILSLPYNELITIKEREG